jgi:hypothetical protein
MPSDNSVSITNVSSMGCIGLSFDVQVSYTNRDAVNGTVVLTCSCGVLVAPSSVPAPGASGEASFTLTHPGAGPGHTITAQLKHGQTVVFTAPVSDVGVGDPCPIVIVGGEGFSYGLPLVSKTAELHGTFDANKGDEVVLLVEERVKINQKEVRPKLVFADSADVIIKGNAGKWKHKPFQGAKSGQHILIILTKNAKVIAIIRAMFK